MGIILLTAFKERVFAPFFYVCPLYFTLALKFQWLFSPKDQVDSWKPMVLSMKVEYYLLALATIALGCCCLFLFIYHTQDGSMDGFGGGMLKMVAMIFGGCLLATLGIRYLY
mmetsp:Transcript_5694/g.9032  ORF Transcript_5694/g.9032 Transcript_5694/m.9032 type:complete len:112 (+) Transcript_5694:84-419(+)